MVDEKEEHYEEEGEYHFSDDQVNYDVEPEAPKTSSASPFTKEALLAKFSQHRRGVLGAVSLIVLIGVVYKILIPASTPPVTEFNQAPITAKATKPVVTKTKSSQSVTAPAALSSVTQPSIGENKPAAPAPVQQNQLPVTPVSAQQNQMPIAGVTVTPPMPVNAQVNTMQPQPSAGVSDVLPTHRTGTEPSSVITPPFTQQTANQANTATPIIDAQTKDRVLALEQQSAAVMNLLQTEYAQKIADTETQANAMRGKMEELARRINRMEANLNQITQLLQGASKSQASSVMGGGSVSNSAARSAEPRMIYSVQAIIPGRAWLKSEAGDTVTVAEGDYLKGYGRVTKIDPYDGIVAIDTGNKVINLSYGISGD